MNTEPDPPTTRTAALLGVLALILTAIAVQPAQGLPPPPPILLSTTLATSIDSPNAVAAGSTFKVMVEARLTSIGATIIQIAPVDDDLDGCGIGSIEVESGVDLTNNAYAVANIPGMFTPAQEEIQFRTLPPYVRIAIGYNTQANLAGVCQAKADVVLPLDPTAPVYHLSKAISLELPAIPLAMGAILSSGGMDVVDQATVVTPATPVFAYTVVSPNPKLQLDGIASHSDGEDFGDYGRFWFGGGTVACGGMSLAEDTKAQAFSCMTDLPHEKGKTIVTRYCFIGYYVDGGSYDTWEEPHGETCSDVSAIEPKGSARDLAPDVCSLFWNAAAQAQFLKAGIAYMLPSTGAFHGTMVNLDHAYWAPVCKDFKPTLGFLI